MMKHQPFFAVALLLLSLTKSSHSLNGVENLLGFGFDDGVETLYIYTKDYDVIELTNLNELMGDPSKLYDLDSHFIVSQQPIGKRWPKLAKYLSNTAQPVQYMFGFITSDGVNSIVLNTIKNDDDKYNSVRYNAFTDKTTSYYVPHDTDKNVNGTNPWVALPINEADHFYSTTGQFIKAGRHSYNDTAVSDNADDYLIMCKVSTRARWTRAFGNQAKSVSWSTCSEKEISSQ